MSIKLSPNIPANVVEIGQEVTQGVVDALNGATSPDATNVFLTRANSFNTADAAVRITQTGAGDALRVEDDNSPDASPFVIDALGNIGIGRNPTARRLEILGNTAITGVFSVDNTGSAGATITQGSGAGAALTIQNNGTGNSFVVNDDAGDTSPFVIAADGSVAIGKNTVQAGYLLDVQGAIRSAGSSLFTAVANVSPVIQVTQSGSADAVRITNTGSGNSFVVEDEANPDYSPFVIDAAGNVGIGTTTPSTKLAVIGTASIAGATAISTSGSTPLAINVTNTSSAVTGVDVDYRGTALAFRIKNNTTEWFSVAQSGVAKFSGSLQFNSEPAISSLTYQTTGLAATVDRTAFPNEVAIVIAGVTYRIPARQV